MIRELESYGVTVHVHDPVAAPEEAQHEYGVDLVSWEHLPNANAIVLAVAHAEFRQRPLEQLCGKLSAGGLVVDVKCQLEPAELESKGLRVWRL